MTLKNAPRSLLTLLLIAPLAIAVLPGCDLKQAGGDASNLPGHDAGPSTLDGVDPEVLASEWPGEVKTISDEADVDTSGGTIQLLQGDVTLEIPNGALVDKVKITVTRQAMSVRGVEVIGYIWGPHGIPIDPVARVTIRVARTDIPPWIVDPEEARLYVVRADDSVEVLGGATAVSSGPSVVLEADMGALETLFIGPLP